LLERTRRFRFCFKPNVTGGALLSSRWGVSEMSVDIFPVEAGDEAPFLKAVWRSRPLFGTWVAPPDSSEKFADHLRKCSTERCYSFLARTADGSLIGCINLNEIVRGFFHSAYLGYYAFEPNQGKGLMKKALSSVISRAFGELGLHRLEANIQPENSRSIGLVKSLGFRLEGYSPRYLKVGEEWRDHERYAITSEEWDVTSGTAQFGRRE
jgi:ribosomal-protein-alanine N-acetyltransferase